MTYLLTIFVGCILMLLNILFLFNYEHWIQFIIIAPLIILGTITCLQMQNEKNKNRKKLIEELNNNNFKLYGKHENMIKEFQDKINEILKQNNMYERMFEGSYKDIYRKMILGEKMTFFAGINNGNYLQKVSIFVKNKNGKPIIINKDVFKNPEKYSIFEEPEKKIEIIYPAARYNASGLHEKEEPNEQKDHLFSLIKNPQLWCWTVDDKIKKEQQEQQEAEYKYAQEARKRRDRWTEEEESYRRKKEDDERWEQIRREQNKHNN